MFEAIFDTIFFLFQPKVSSETCVKERPSIRTRGPVNKYSSLEWEKKTAALEVPNPDSSKLSKSLEQIGQKGSQNTSARFVKMRLQQVWFGHLHSFEVNSF